MFVGLSAASHCPSPPVTAATGIYDSSGDSGLAVDEEVPALCARQTDVPLPQERQEGMGHSIVHNHPALMERLGTPLHWILS